MGAVPVFGFTRAKSAAERGKHRSGSPVSDTSCRIEGAQRAGSFGEVPGARDEGAELEPDASTSGKNGGAS